MVSDGVGRFLLVDVVCDVVVELAIVYVLSGICAYALP